MPNYKNSMKKVIITGITGQDGSYLAELLLSKGYEVYGFLRKENLDNAIYGLRNLINIKDKIKLIPVRITDPLSLYKQISKIKPDEFYHLASYSFVNYDMNDETNIMSVNFNATLYIVNALKEINPYCKMFFAGSSEMFGNPIVSPQNEDISFNPKSLYGISKIASYYLLKNSREKDDMFLTTGIMYNHESPRRGKQFVTKKIISTAVKIKLGLSKKIELGNLEAQRDWGYALDYVNAMYLILQQKKPDDYIIATGKLHSVKELVEIVFDYLKLDYKKYIIINEDFYRESEKKPLVGDIAKIKNIGWKISKAFKTVIYEMIEAEKIKYEK